MNTPPAFGTRGLAKGYGDLVALEPLDIDVPAGQRVMLIGHNGAGKTTLMRMAAGLLEPTAGRAWIFGARAGSLAARARLSYLPDTPVLYDDLSLREHVEYTCRLHGAEGWQDRADGLLADLGLHNRVDDLPARFSRGLKQKTAIVLALVRPFGLLMIDEPFVGLDPQGREVLLERLAAAAAAGAALVVATHQMDFARHADRCIALHDGAVVYDGPVDEVDVQSLTG